MLLTGFNIAHYLLDKGHLPVDALLDGTFTAHQTSSRNTSYLINQGQPNALFVKQVPTYETDKTDTLRTEATCYWLANHETDYAGLRAFLPRYVDFDAQHHILLTEAVDDALSLNDFYLRHKTFPPALATQQAELLSTFHQTLSKRVQDGPSMRLFRRQLPTIFLWSAAGFASYGSRQSEAEQQMIRLITQNETYVKLLAAVREQWQATSLIHGDVKPANFLINADCLQTNQYDLRLIDWETADVGDPCWDAAAVFQSYLFYWVMHEPLPGQTALPTAGFSLDAMQPTMRQFWQTYAGLMPWTADEARANLRKTVGYCALKLIHTCYESIKQAPAMTPHTARLLQLSLNLLRTPDEAIRTVLNLS
ncbi:MAG: phosphotransferase [Spirosoma sp.]|nr:phosphotransferase [Spirosoma sp.]